MTHISDIKLIRTDTTLDLSQKAEKGMLSNLALPPFLYPALVCDSFRIPYVGLLSGVSLRQKEEP